MSTISNRLRTKAPPTVPSHRSAFGPADSRFASRLRNLPASENRTFTGGRKLLVCRDNEEILVAHLGGSERPYAVRTRNRLLIDELSSGWKSGMEKGNGKDSSLTELLQA